MMPYPKGYVRSMCGNRLIMSELDYDVNLLKAEYQRHLNSLTGIFMELNNNFYSYY